MKSPHETYAELRGIVEALCEERMTPDQARRLEAIARDDREARRYFLDYIELHGNLFWDAAQGDLDSEVATPAVRRPAAAIPAPQAAGATRRRFGRRQALPLAAASAALLALLWLGWQFTQTGRQHADQAVDRGMAVALHGREREFNERRAEVRTAERSELSPSKTVPAAIDLNPAAVPKPELVDRPARAADPADADDHDPTGVVEFIDERIRSAWSKAKVVPAARAADGEWLRRTSLGIVGHIPTEEVVDAFLADADPQKRTALVDRLLQESDYARAWSALWTAQLVGRGDPAPGVIRDALETHLVRRFSVNAPWNEIVFELISAEGFADRQPAVNFLLAHRDHGMTSATEAIGRLFLGHAHAGDDGQARFWELHSFLGQTEAILPTANSTSTTAELVSRPVAGPAFYESFHGQKRAAFPKFAGHEIDAGAKTNRRRELARLIARSDDPQLARAIVDRMWSLLFGAPLVASLDGPAIDKGSPRSEILARLSKEFIAANYDLKQLIRWICATEAYQLTSGGDAAFATIVPRPMLPEQLYESLLVAGRAPVSPPDQWESAARRRHEWVRGYVLRHPAERQESALPADALPHAIALMNDALVHAAVDTGVKTLPAELAATSLDDDAKVRRLCRSTLSRDPRDIELAAGGQILAESRRPRSVSDADRVRDETQALEDVYWAFLNAREFTLVK